MDKVAHKNPVKQVGYAMVYHVATLDPELSDGALRTLHVYLMHAQQKNVCWPSRARVAELRGKSEVTISRHNEELERLGYIARERRMDDASMTYILDYEQNPRFRAMAEAILAARTTDDTSDVSKTIRATLQKRHVEEEPVEEEPGEEEQRAAPPRPKPSSPSAGRSDPDYVDVGNEFGDRSRSPIARHILRVGHRQVSKRQDGKLMAGVPLHNPEYKSPNALFLEDPDFAGYLEELLAWANGANGDGRKATGRLINAIRNYEREDTGWLAYKERLSAGGGGTPSQTHEEERHRDRYEKQLEGL